MNQPFGAFGLWQSSAQHKSSRSWLPLFEHRLIDRYIIKARDKVFAVCAVTDAWIIAFDLVLTLFVLIFIPDRLLNICLLACPISRKRHL